MPEFCPFHSKRAAARSLILLFLRIATLLGGFTGALAKSVMLEWNPSPETDIGRYEIHYGTSADQLNTILHIGRNSTTANLQGLAADTTYYCAILACNQIGLKSPLSNQIIFSTRTPPAILVKGHATAPLYWGDVINLGDVNLGAISEMRTFTVTNTRSTTLNGLAMVLRGQDIGSFSLSGNFPITKMVEFNGSFETELSPWTVAGNVAAGTIQGATTGLWAAVFSAGESPNNGMLSRSFPTTPGTTYSLSFDVGVLSNNTNEQRLQTRVTGTDILLTDTTIINGPDDGSTIWSPRSFIFVADSNSTTLSFTDISSSTEATDLLLDNVRVTEQFDATEEIVITALAPGESTSFSIAYQPGTSGIHDAVLSLTCDPDNTVLLEIHATGTVNALFETWLSSNELAGGPTGNPDGDAFNNLLEFAFGTDPTAAHGKHAAESNGKLVSRGSPVPRIVTSPTFGFRGQFSRRKNHKAAGLIYLPQFSADLITWMDATAAPEMHADDGEIEIVSVASPTVIDGQVPRFFRVGVNQKPKMSLSEWLDEHAAGGGMYDNQDGDALNNFFEFAFGTDPAVAHGKSAAEVNGLLASRGAPAVRVTGSPGTPGFEFKGLFCRRKDRASHGLIYKPQFSTDLVNWVDANEAPAVRADDGEIEVVSVSPPDSLDSMTPRFFRVGLSILP